MSLKASPPSITSLLTFNGSMFYSLDEMHLLSEGLSKQINNFMHYQHNSKYIPESCLDINYTFAYKDDVRVATINGIINKKITNSAKFIPTSFQGSWNEINGYYRAVDWLDYLLYIVPTIVFPYLKHQNTKDNLMELINGCTIALQWSLTSVQVNRMNK